MAKEIWKECKNHKGYFVSNLGRVKSEKRNYVNGFKILKQTTKKDGYKRVHIKYDDFDKHVYVHRLVANAFLENVNGKKYINHNNGIKDDNRPENLEWCTHKENIQHAQQNGMRDAVVGENNHLAKLTETDVLDIRNTHNLGFVTQQELADAWNVGRTTIRAIIDYKTWKHI